jgi:hypothetical protein
MQKKVKSRNTNGKRQKGNAMPAKILAKTKQKNPTLQWKDAGHARIHFCLLPFAF